MLQGGLLYYYPSTVVSLLQLERLIAPLAAEINEAAPEPVLLHQPFTMKSFNSYFHPATKKGEVEEARKSSSLEMKVAPLSPDASASALGTPRSFGSRPASIYPEGDFRNAAANDVLEIKCDVMVNWLHQQQLESMWTSCGAGEGVVLKKIKDRYTACPSDLAETRGDLFDAVRALNVKVAPTD